MKEDSRDKKPSELSPEDRKLGRAPLSVSEEDGSDGLKTETGVESRTVENTMEDYFLRYSLSVIVDRALPDVRDGLKPVNRRILYAMNKNGWKAPHAKSRATMEDALHLSRRSR